LMAIVIGHDSLTSNILHNTVAQLNDFTRHMVDANEDCPPFNSDDIDDWEDLSP